MTRTEQIIEVMENYGHWACKSHTLEALAQHLADGGFIATFDSGNSGEDDTMICFGAKDFSSATKCAEETVDGYWMECRTDEDSEDRPDDWQIIEVLKIRGDGDDMELVGK